MNILSKTAKTLTLMSVIALVPLCTLADEGGSSYWLEGVNGSLAASKLTPGCSSINIFFFEKQHETATAPLPNGGTATAKVNTTIPIYIPGVSCTPTTKILDGQLTASLSYPVAFAHADVSATAGGQSASLHDANTGMGDMYPNVNLRWNHGVHNFMVYEQPGAPVYTYDPTRLANLGAGRMTLDQGVAYTYLNPKNRLEFSVQPGFTYNFMNNKTEKVKFGLKPTLRIVQVVTMQGNNPNEPAYAIAEKQLYFQPLL